MLKILIVFTIYVYAAMGISGAEMNRRAPVPINIVAFGTSLTERADWPLELKARLSSCSDGVTIEKIAKSGATTAWGVTKIDAVVQRHPDVVLVELYVNDAALNRLLTIGQSRKNYSFIMDRLRRELPNARIILLGMSPAWGLKGAIRPFVNTYLDVHRQETLVRGGEFIDFREDWLRLSTAELRDAIPDGTHPLPDIAARVMIPKLLQALAAKPCP